MRCSALLLLVSLAGCTSNSVIDPGHDAGTTLMDTGNGEDAFASGDDANVDGGHADTGGGADTGAPADTGADANLPDAGPCMAAGACDPFTATSCGAGMACRPGATGTSCHATSATTVGVGMPCAHAEDCEAGLVCLTFTAGEGPTCHRMCHARSVGECDTGYACNGTFGDTCINVCRPIPPACDIYAQNCAMATDTCTLVRNPETNAPYTGCRPAGTQNEGQPCGGAAGTCNHALICVSLSGIAGCRHVCDATVTPDTCTAPAACTGLAMTWGVHYCQAP
jgi:hypothetical protein